MNNNSHTHTGFNSIIMLTLLSTALFLFTGCGSDPAGTNGDGGGGGNGGGNGTTTQPTFTNVQFVLNDNCGGSGCHINERTSGVRLDSYSNVINSVGDQYDKNIVQPNEPDNSPIVDKIEPSPQFGDRMPLGGSALSDDEITLIRDWINEGAQDN